MKSATFSKNLRSSVAGTLPIQLPIGFQEGKFRMKRIASFSLAPVLLAGAAVLLPGMVFGQETNSASVAFSGVNLAAVATASSSSVSGDTTLEALNDGFEPRNSGDTRHRSYGNWPQRGTQWVQYDWSQPVSTRRIDVYWWVDGQGIRAPSASRLLYWDGKKFMPVASASGLEVAAGRYNTTTFDEVRTSKLRLEMDGDGTYSTGILEWKVYDSGKSPRFPPAVTAGVDRDVVLGGKTYLNGKLKSLDGGDSSSSTVTWSKASGPGAVAFENVHAATTTAKFSALGNYVLKLTANDGPLSSTSALNVKVVAPPPAVQLDAVYTKNFKINNPLWNSRAKALISGWIPHCVDEINDPNLIQGGMNNFIEAAKQLKRNELIKAEGAGQGPSEFLASDIKDLPGLAAKLSQRATPAAAWVWEQLDPALQKQITKAGSSADQLAQVRATLALGLNKILASTNIYEEARFNGVELRPTTRAGLRPQGGGRGGQRPPPQGQALAYVNRLLLEDVFPRELARIPIHHIGYPFSNAWVHQTVESMCIALMVDPQGDPAINKAQQKIRETLEDWIPKILAAQEGDGYLQTRFTLGTDNDRGPVEHWNPRTRGEHEGYVAGYFIESAINNYTMTNGKDRRLYDAAKKLADCWYNNIGPAPKKPWFDGHQEMEQALVRFGRFVNDVEGAGKGEKYIQLAKFLLDSRAGGSEYDQSHLPVVQQYEAVGHAVRAVYTYSGMADVAVETHDLDYQSAVMSLWDNLVNKKYYVTGGVGSGERNDEGFGPNYSLRNNAYCESCSSCGEIFFQWKMNLAYQDARYVDLYEETLYNALLGATDLKGEIFYYTNPLEGGQRTPWHTCPCCVGNIPRTLLMLPTWMYARSKDGIYVNLFIGSTVTVENIAGTDVQMVQATDYPWNGKVSITVNPAATKKFTVNVRIPNRATSELYSSTPAVSGLTSISLNGSPIKPKIDKGYAAISRTWKAGDKIELELPLKVQKVKASDKIAADRGLVTLRFGPLIYNVERADQQDISQPIDSKALLTAEWKGDLLDGVMVIKGKWADGSTLTAIPNYARNNRNTQTPGGGRGGRPSSSNVWLKDQ
jgi:DUF1680 family protein